MSHDDYWNTAADALAADLSGKRNAVLLHFLRTAPLEAVASLAGGAFARTTEKTQASICKTLAAKIESHREVEALVDEFFAFMPEPVTEGRAAVLALRFQPSYPNIAIWFAHRLGGLTAIGERELIPWATLLSLLGGAGERQEWELRKYFVRYAYGINEMLKTATPFAVGWVELSADGVILVPIARVNDGPAGWTHAETSTPGGSGETEGE